MGKKLYVSATATVLMIVSACGTAPMSSSSASGSPTAKSPSPSTASDAATSTYIALIHQYWIDLIAAEGDAPTACFSGPIDPAECKARAQAQLAVQEKFLADLKTAQVPPQFATPNGTLLMNLPIAITDLQAMISASSSRSSERIFAATTAYVSQMQPTITGALDRIDPAVDHER